MEENSISLDQGEYALEEARTKKRRDNSADYSRNIIKQARIHGQAYVTPKNKIVPAKTIGPPCQCAKKCCETITEDNKIEIFNKLYDLSTKNEQDIYLQGLIICKDIKRRRVQKENPLRQKTFLYTVQIGNEKKEVCNSAFLSLFGITKERVKRLRNLLVLGKLPEDKRGKSQAVNAMPTDQISEVISHISSFKAKESHYSSGIIKYLPADLSVKKMFRLYKEKHNETRIKYEYYNKIFRENFALRFGRPAVDTCCLCEHLDLRINSKSLNDVAKKVALAEKQVHKKRSKKFYTKLQEARQRSQEDETFLGICYDYMQNISLPIIPVQEIFYLRQLSVSIFCIHNLKTGKNVLFMYHEGQAKKGPNEVCSFVMTYIKKYVDPKVIELMLFSDNCAGQNKNNTAIRMNMALVDSGRFRKIQQIFPMRGHSFLPCDRAFGIIKRSLRRKERLYDIQELLELIVSSSRQTDFFTVHLVSGKDVTEFKKWWVQHFKKTAISLETKDRRIPRTEKVSFSISKFHHLTFKKIGGDVPVRTREFIDGAITHTFLLKIRPLICTPLPQESAYGTRQLCINEKKMEDLKKCVQFIPEQKKKFWDKILQWPTAENIADEDLD